MAVKVINFIVKRSALTHQQFQSLFKEMDCTYKDIPLHSVVRWLSSRKVLEWFVGCFDAIKAFLAEKDQDDPELKNEKWVVKQIVQDSSMSSISDCKVQGILFWTCSWMDMDDFCQQASNLFKRCCYLHFTLLQTRKEAVLTTQPQHCWNMQIHEQIWVGVHNTIRWLSEIWTHVPCLVQAQQLWWAQIEFISDRLVGYTGYGNAADWPEEFNTIGDYVWRAIEQLETMAVHLHLLDVCTREVQLSLERYSGTLPLDQHTSGSSD